jgi:hypothetical protein
MGQYAFLANYRNSFGMTVADLRDPGNGMVGAWIILVVEWFVFMLLAWYLEQVFASGTGNRRHPLYFLDSCRKVRVSLSWYKASGLSTPRSDLGSQVGFGVFSVRLFGCPGSESSG